MTQQIDPTLKNRLLNTAFRPAVTLWNRLEGRARHEDFDRSLRAEIRDPLWMLTRQWQVGELKGEDAGSAAKARVRVDTGRIDRFAVKAEDSEAAGGKDWLPALGYDTDMPLEVQVEREPVWAGGAASLHDGLALRAQAGRQWSTLLRRAGLQDLKKAFVAQFGFEELVEPLETAHVQSDPAAWQALQAFVGRLPDGRRLLAAIDDGSLEAWAAAQPFDTSTQEVLRDLAKDFRDWFYRLYSQPDLTVEDTAEDAWAPPYLEYQFAVSAPADASESSHTMLVADQYHQGHLDWYAFGIDPKQRLDAPPSNTPGNNYEQRATLAVVPTQIEFNGMPNVRWWEIEDRRTSFGNIRAGTTDIPLLLLAEFGLIYGNDWSVLPYNLPVGTLAEIKGLIVTDVFGVRTFIRAAGQGQGMDWQKWSMYGLTNTRSNDGAADHRLFLAPAVAKTQEGDPLEKVIFARDEMTNMVWAVEERIPGVLGGGVDGFESATALSRYFLEHHPAPGIVPEASEAGIRYVLGNSVPENWIPFIARHRPGSQRLVRLQRASMPRLTDALPLSRVEPRGRILRTGLEEVPRQPYFLHEEEVPRAGAIVTRGFQRARWFDGKVYTWIGRRKETGRGQGASGLVFDRVEPRQAEGGGM